jgi:hypothetical protein
MLPRLVCRLIASRTILHDDLATPTLPLFFIGPIPKHVDVAAKLHTFRYK